ncbi:response regulator transcription factor [candidate division WOR-3 bacterium]|nr:response regulator transcription factor [candidate division WOR-3 bacterium]
MSEDRKRILVVEDEDNLRELVTGRLQQHGYEVEVACDGYEALARFRAQKPDLVVLDLMLPKMDGFAVCRVLKASVRDSTVPVILFSARFSPEDRLRGEEMGANAFVNKPFDPPVLLAKIHELLYPEEPAPELPPEPAAAAPPVAPPTTPAPGPVAPQPAAPTREERETAEEAAAARPARPPTRDELAGQVRPPEPKEQPAAPEPAPAAGPAKEGFFQKLLRVLFKKV